MLPPPLAKEVTAGGRAGVASASRAGGPSRDSRSRATPVVRAEEAVTEAAGQHLSAPGAAQKAGPIPREEQRGAALGHRLGGLAAVRGVWLVGIALSPAACGVSSTSDKLPALRFLPPHVPLPPISASLRESRRVSAWKCLRCSLRHSRMAVSLVSASGTASTTYPKGGVAWEWW